METDTPIVPATLLDVSYWYEILVGVDDDVKTSCPLDNVGVTLVEFTLNEYTFDMSKLAGTSILY